MLPRLWGNNKIKPKKNGSLTDNGTGKFSDIDKKTLDTMNEELNNRKLNASEEDISKDVVTE